MLTDTTDHQSCFASPPLCAVSPALQPRARGNLPAFEMKFLVDELQAQEIENRMAAQLLLDPYADRELGDSYLVTTVYCDTPGLDVFHQVGSHKRRKYRARRYGSEPRVYLERKTKAGQRVRKRRTMIDSHELESLSASARDKEWAGQGFTNTSCFGGWNRPAASGTDAKPTSELTPRDRYG